jgi:hypothetical protein
MVHREYQPGDWVVFRVTKYGVHPGPRASNVIPAQNGDSYRYTIDKFWIVVCRTSNGQLSLRTRRGKEHVVAADDIRLRKANIWERWRYKSRFEEIERTQLAKAGDFDSPSQPGVMIPS